MHSGCDVRATGSGRKSHRAVVRQSADALVIDDVSVRQPGARSCQFYIPVAVFRVAIWPAVRQLHVSS